MPRRETASRRPATIAQHTRTEQSKLTVAMTHALRSLAIDDRSLLFRPIIWIRRAPRSSVVECLRSALSERRCVSTLAHPRRDCLRSSINVAASGGFLGRTALVYPSTH